MNSNLNPHLASLKGGLIISVQQDEGSPLNRPEIIAALAQAVSIPGVVGLRLNGPENIAAVRQRVALPIIGIYKVYDSNGRVWITPDFAKARLLVEAGAEIIALDATVRPRPDGPAANLIHRIQSDLGVFVMADISTDSEGLEAAQAGADIVATTLSGYTQKPFANPFDPPDLSLVNRLAAALPATPIISEGRFSTPDWVRLSFQAGAFAVVVGSAITRPDLITRAFLQALL